MFIRDIFIDRSRIEPGSYLLGIDALRGVDRITLKSPVTFFVGENGSGKSTLLEAIAIAEGFNPEGGTRNYRFATYDSHSELYKALRLSRIAKAKWGFFLRAESFYNVATKEEEYGNDVGGRPLKLHERSYGESFFRMMREQFHENGLYVLDEPEAALSPQRQLALLREIDLLRRKNAQFIIATHSPILLGLPGAQILSFEETGIRECAYEDTESYIITRLFLTNRESVLRDLLGE